MEHDPLGHCDYTVLGLRQSGELGEHSIVGVRHVDGFRCRCVDLRLVELDNNGGGREIKESARVVL